MERVSGITILLAVGIALSLPSLSVAQAPQPAQLRRDGVGLAITYSALRSNTASAGNGFWLSGAAAEADVPVLRGSKTQLALAADLTYGHSGGIGAGGAALDTLSFTAGPRLIEQFPYRGKPRLVAFAEVMAGVEHGFNSVFPVNGGTTGAATSFALMTGGGLDLISSHRVGVRLIQIDYVRSQLPNGYANVQNDLRLAAGVAFRFGRR